MSKMLLFTDAEAQFLCVSMHAFKSYMESTAVFFDDVSPGAKQSDIERCKRKIVIIEQKIKNFSCKEK